MLINAPPNETSGQTRRPDNEPVGSSDRTATSQTQTYPKWGPIVNGYGQPSRPIDIGLMNWSFLGETG